MRRFILMPVLALTLATVLSGCIIAPDHGYRYGHEHWHEHGPYAGGGWGGHHDRW